MIEYSTYLLRLHLIAPSSIPSAGSAAGGVGELESVEGTGVKEVTEAVKEAAEEAKGSEEAKSSE